MTSNQPRKNVPYTPVVTRGPSRAIAEKLPEAVAAAVIEFITGPLIENPRRIGKPMHAELTGTHSARRGEWRIIYRIDEQAHEVHVIRVDHRGAVYHRR